jgi:hypothetical protein
LRFRSLARNPGAGRMNLRVDTQPGFTYQLQSSTNLRDWQPVQTNTPSAYYSDFTDPNAPANLKFYRVIKQ